MDTYTFIVCTKIDDLYKDIGLTKDELGGKMMTKFVG